jgi:hypothetical protein
MEYEPPAEPENEVGAEGLSLDAWMARAQEAGAVEYWRDGRIRPSTIPLELVGDFLSSDIYASICAEMQGFLDRFVDLARGDLPSWLASRANLIGLPKYRHIETLKVSFTFFVLNL